MEKEAGRAATCRSLPARESCWLARGAWEPGNVHLAVTLRVFDVQEGRLQGRGCCSSWNCRSVRRRTPSEMVSGEPQATAAVACGSPLNDRDGHFGVWL